MQGNGLKLETGSGEKLSARLIGTNEKYGLLFLHALLSNTREIEPLAEKLGKLYTVLLFEYRGHGNSDGRRGHVTEARILRDIRVAMDYLAQKVSHVGVIGYSTGGAFALKYATLDPRVELLIAISPVVRFKDTFPPEKKILGLFSRKKKPTEFVDNWISYKMLFAKKDILSKAQKIRFLLRKTTVATRELFSRFSVLELASNIVIPTLIIAGKEDRISPIKSQKQLYERIGTQDKKLVVINGCGHSLILECPDAMEHIIEWIKERW